MTTIKPCGAKTRSGEPCKLPPIKDATRCRMHGGATPQSRRAVAVRQTEVQARRLLDELAIVPVDNPLTELCVLAGRAKAWMEIIERQVAALESVSSGGDSEQVRAVIAVYERAMDRLGRFLEGLARLNIDERLVRISEQQAEAVVAAVDAGLSAVGVVDIERRETARRAVGLHLQRRSAAG